MTIEDTLMEMTIDATDIALDPVAEQGLPPSGLGGVGTGVVDLSRPDPGVVVPPFSTESIVRWNVLGAFTRP